MLIKISYWIWNLCLLLPDLRSSGSTNSLDINLSIIANQNIAFTEILTNIEKIPTQLVYEKEVFDYTLHMSLKDWKMSQTSIK